MKTANAKKSASTKSAPKAEGANGSTMNAALRAPVVVDADAYVAEHGHLLAGLPTKRLRISVVSLCADANTLLEIAAPRRDRIIGAGCEARFLDELPMRVALAQACQTLRQSSRISYSSAERASIDECQAHRNEMMRVCRHAFRKDADVQKSLTSLQEGTGIAHGLEALAHGGVERPYRESHECQLKIGYGGVLAKGDRACPETRDIERRSELDQVGYALVQCGAGDYVRVRFELVKHRFSFKCEWFDGMQAGAVTRPALGEGHRRLNGSSRWRMSMTRRLTARGHEES